MNKNRKLRLIDRFLYYAFIWVFCFFGKHIGRVYVYQSRPRKNVRSYKYGRGWKYQKSRYGGVRYGKQVYCRFCGRVLEPYHNDPLAKVILNETN